MTDTICPHCGNYFTPDPISIGRKCLKRESWGGSPALHFAGAFSDLETLQAAGLAKRDAAGWWIPTELGKLALA